MSAGDPVSLRQYLGSGRGLNARYLYGFEGSVRLSVLVRGSILQGRLGELSGRSVLLKTKDQYPTALALLELDGIARRIVICPPCFPAHHLPCVLADAEIDAAVTDDNGDERLDAGLRFSWSSALVPAPQAQERRRTEWLLLTSGTTGAPKMVVHDLAGLTEAIKTRTSYEPGLVWGTFYDIRRYGGLQIYLRALLSGGSLVLSGLCEAASAFLARLRDHRVTHLSGTPSHWRRVLMTPGNELPDLIYLRLSGEIADQGLLDALGRRYPHAKIGHAYASTEAGVVLDVADGLEGVPAALIEAPADGVEIRILDGTLRVRSRRTASRYAGHGKPELKDADGFVDTGDVLRRNKGRYYFLGRKGGIVNVGGLKVHPEEVEAVINRHPDVRMSLVRARKNPFTGAVVVADVLLNETEGSRTVKELESEILEICRNALPEHKVPAVIRFVPHLDVAQSGKLVRHDA
jgi:acyl-coenzyme A synthetase/AMP-(fatty) acid ligase